MLSCENLTVAYGDNTIFTGLGFSLMPGSLMCLRGGNGSGKTTLLKALAGLVNPEEGRVEYEGKLQYLGHKTAIKPKLTVAENLCFYAELYNSTELLLAGISYFDLIEVMDVPCCKLSAGWQKRVALARLMVCYSDIWLLDEPEVHLDEKGRDMLFKLLHVRVSQGGTVVLTSHGELPFSAFPIVQMEDFKMNQVKSK